MTEKKTKTKWPFKNYYCYCGRPCTEAAKAHPENYDFEEKVKQK